jgi:Ca2+-binding RTX toxin-like protein
MTRRRLRQTVAGAVAALALLALPGTASAAVGGPYALTGAGGSSLTATPVTPGSALVVQALQSAATIEFTPQAVATVANPLPGGCSNATPGRTVCGAPAVALTLTGAVVEAGVRDVVTATLTFTGGSANDSFRVDGASSVDNVRVTPGDGADSVTLVGNIRGLALVGADPGDDRYDIQTVDLPVSTLALGAGSDVAANHSPNLRLEGGAGNDTLSGPGPLAGDAGDDLLEPTVPGQIADGGADVDRLSFDLIDTGLAMTKIGTQVTLAGAPKTGIEQLEGGRGPDTITGSAAADDIAGGDGNDTIAGGGGGDTLDGGPGDNTVSYASAGVPVNVDLTAGRATIAGVVDTLSSFRGVTTGAAGDTVFGSPADEHFDLGAGDDSLNAGPGNDVLAGGSGDDLLRGGHGTDVIDGGPGRDTATYDERTASEPVSVTLATAGDDGAPGENDTLGGIEDVIGGASSDVLGGDAGPNMLVGGGGLNTIDGGAGNDTLIGGEFRDVIVGGPGNDTLIGGGDDDSLSAFDGEADNVDCGPSADDDAQVDAVDSVVGCEFASRGDVPVPVDADHDGTVAGFDCDDGNPAIGLTAIDIPGDGIDQNCDGFDEPLALVAGGLRFDYKASARGTRITQLDLPDLQAASTVLVTCKTAIKRRCPFTRATRRPKATGGLLSLTALFKRRVLPVGTRIDVRITAPGVIGRVRRFTMVRSATPRRADLCVLPGSSVAKTCPSAVL